MHDGAVLDDSARVHGAGHAAGRPMKCVSWICRSMAGPPLRAGSAIPLDQSGLEITRHQVGGLERPVAAGLNRLEGEGKLGEERQDMADHEQFARGPRPLPPSVGGFGRQSAIGFSTSTCLPA